MGNQEENQVIYIYDPQTFKFIAGISFSGDIPSNATLVPPTTKVGDKEVKLENAIWDVNTNSWQGTSPSVLTSDHVDELTTKVKVLTDKDTVQESEIKQLQGQLQTLQDNFNTLNDLVTMLLDDGSDETDTDETNTDESEANA